MKYALILLTPRNAGGTEMSLFHLKKGFIELGHEADVIAVGNSSQIAKWHEYNRHNVDISITNSFDLIENLLSEYDGIILSNMTDDASTTLLRVIFTSNKIPAWSCARHWNTMTAAAAVWQKHADKSPKWSGSYVSFWPSARQIKGAKWVQSTLPFTFDDPKTPLPLESRPVDFLFMGRAEHKKGLFSFTTMLEGLRRQKALESSSRPFSARIAGAPMQLPGGPVVWVASQQLKSWGWNVTYTTTNRSSTWTAVSPQEDVIEYTGTYSGYETESILDSAKIYYNLTASKFAPEHLEYSTMEAIVNGGIVCAADDWPEYQYPPELVERPKIVAVPRSAVDIRKGSRAVYTDKTDDAFTTTFVELIDQACRAYGMISDSDRLAAATATAYARWEQNVEILRTAHDPKIAATSYIDALSGGGEDV